MMNSYILFDDISSNSKRVVRAKDKIHKPLCECHGLEMAWQKMDRLSKGGHWRCKANLYSSQRKARLKKFGITENEYEEMFVLQNGKCAICRNDPDTRWKKLAVDHDHKTGKIRGLLCMTCNTMLGRLENRYDAVMEYLSK